MRVLLASGAGADVPRIAYLVRHVRRMRRARGSEPVRLRGFMTVRLKKLWEKRLASIKAAATASDHAAELAAFGWWFVSQKFDNAWAMSQLLAVLSLPQKAEPDYLVVERLVTLAATMPLEAVQCLTMMVQRDKENWNIQSWHDDSRKILATAISSGNSAARQAAIELVNRLAARGMPDYKDLIEK